jgi:glutamate racemase
MLTPQSPIGFFDSGVGGTSIWKEMRLLLPKENTIYLADSKNAPYGHKTKEEIIALSRKNTDYLIAKGAKLIVVACNTATTNAIDYLRNSYPKMTFIGIEPAIKPAALHTKTNAIGVLATAGTLSSTLFASTSEKFASEVKVIEQVGEGLVELIETNQKDSKQTDRLLLKYLKPMLAENVDYIILGCTHYPYLLNKIKNIAGKSVNIIDSGFAVSKQIKNVLKEKRLLNLQTDKPVYEFYTNTTTKTLETLLSDIQVPLRIVKELF